MRMEKSIKNIKYSLISQMLTFIIQFVTRTVFVYTLGKEYLGINGLFTNILTILSLADMGIGTVLIYSMYEPLYRKDKIHLKKLINEYKKIYNIIALIIFVIGLSIMPFLRFIIKDIPDVGNIYFIYFLYLLNTVITYLCIYKTSIINADQKEYIVVFYQQLFNIISNILIIIFLIITKNFIIYLLIKMLFSIFSNIFLSKKADKMYPEIIDTKDYILDKSEKKKIYDNAYAMIFHKIGGVVVSGTDNILMSIMVSISSVGLYSNYYLIVNSIKTFSTQIFNSLTASVGNLNVEKNMNHSYNIFNKIFLLNFLIYGFCGTCLFILLNRFISLWLGDDYLFSVNIVFLISLMFFVDGMRITVQIFRNSMGIFKQDKYKPIIEAILNILISILLTKKIGVAGIFLGTIISMLVVCTFEEPYFLFKYGYDNMKWYKSYCLKLLKYYIEFLSILLAIYLITNIIPYTIIGFIITIIVTVIISILMLVIVNISSNELKDILLILKQKILTKIVKYRKGKLL